MENYIYFYFSDHIIMSFISLIRTFYFPCAGFDNIFNLTVGWNMIVCIVMAVAQLSMWAVWAGFSKHPSRWKLWFVVFAGGLAMLLEIYDFPPHVGLFDAHAIWHATTIPLTYIWWSFIRDDAVFRTSNLVKKAK